MQKLNIEPKIILLTALLTIGAGITGCQKSDNDADAKSEEVEEVVMSAEPAENETPTIVASDLDDADAQLNETTVTDGMDQNIDDAVQNNGAMNNSEVAQTEEGQISAPTSEKAHSDTVN